MKTLYIVLLSFCILLVLSCAKDGDPGMGDTGTGGSMARFTIKDQFLYTVDMETMNIFSIADSTQVTHLHNQYLGFGIETIFPTGDHLFIGARNGMHIYGLNDPSKPEYLSFTPHFVSYDPVVVQGDFAYVTLRTGDRFRNGANQLLIFDVSKPNSPVRLAEYDMVGPRGLGIDGDKLFICDDVLKVYRVTNGKDISLITSFDVPAIDVIPHGNRLYVIAEDGFYQYDYSGNNITLLSKIVLERK